MFHPSVLLLLWCGLLLLTQVVEGAVALVVALGVSGFAAWRSGSRFGALVRRTRYLMLALVVIFAWGSPGYLIWPQAGWASPSAEGVSLALTHAARLLCVLSLVAWLLVAMPTPRLVAALHGLCWPLQWLGLDRSRAAVRLSLVLEYTASARGGPTHWRQWLAEPAEPVAHAELELPHQPLRLPDWLALAALSGALFGLALWSLAPGPLAAPAS